MKTEDKRNLRIKLVYLALMSFTKIAKLRWAFVLLLSLNSMTVVTGQTDASDIAQKPPADFKIFNLPSQEDRLLVQAYDALGQKDDFTGEWKLYYDEGSILLFLEEGSATMDKSIFPKGIQLFRSEGKVESHRLYFISPDKPPKHIPLWITILPPLLAIGLALVMKEVLISLFAGLWLGGFIAAGFNAEAVLLGLFQSFDTYMVGAISKSGHPEIILFSMMIGAMVAMISKNGGMRGTVNLFARVANSARNTQLATWMLGIAIFFDDYANTLIVGHTMRPVTDRFKVSREKLAYIVDSTAAPIAAVAFITTWIGAEIGYIQDALVNMPGMKETAYGVFLNSLKYAYYPVFTLIFILALILFERDYGEMWKAERKARQGIATPGFTGNDTSSEIEPKEGLRSHWLYGLFPVLSLLVTTVVVLINSGLEASGWNNEEGLIGNLQVAIGMADSFKALVWGSGMGLLVAGVLSVAGKKLSIKESGESVLSGFKVMLPAMAILILAWSLASVIGELHTEQFLISLLPEHFNPFWLPVVFFLLSAIVSFSTGSSWGTMAILYPICLQLTWEFCRMQGMPIQELQPILYNSTAVILAGSVLGDHCSPISDTTILSSMASGCDHIAHVRTQMPYALTVGFVAILTGGLFFAIGMPWWLNYLVGIILLVAFVRFYGKTQKTKGT